MSHKFYYVNNYIHIKIFSSGNMVKTERIQFRVSKKNKDKIKRKCDNMGITISEYMNRQLFSEEGQ